MGRALWLGFSELESIANSGRHAQDILVSMSACRARVWHLNLRTQATALTLPEQDAMHLQWGSFRPMIWAGLDAGGSARGEMFPGSTNCGDSTALSTKMQSTNTSHLYSVMHAQVISAVSQNLGPTEPHAAYSPRLSCSSSTSLQMFAPVGSASHHTACWAREKSS
jgi:hypothetical protein